jgi:hypothetical protein
MVLIAVLAVVASLVTATTAPAQSCGREALDDSYDNGTIDRSWSCKCLLDGLTLPPEDGRTGYVSVRDEIERHVRAECTGWPVPVSDSGLETTFTESARTPEATFTESATTVEATFTEFHPAASETGDSIYSVPWAIVIAGIVSGGLVVLIGAAAVRQWRLRP